MEDKKNKKQTKSKAKILQKQIQKKKKILKD